MSAGPRPLPPPARAVRLSTLTGQRREAFEPCALGVLAELLAPGPVHRSEAQAALGEVYAIAGLTWPRTVLWADSPWHAQQVLAELALTHARTTGERVITRPLELNTGWLLNEDMRRMIVLRGAADRAGLVSVLVHDALSAAIGALLTRQAVLELDHVESSGALPGREHTRFGDGFDPADRALRQVYLKSQGGIYRAAELVIWDAFLNGVCGLEPDNEDLWGLSRAVRRTRGVPWWPLREHLVICDRPAEVHRSAGTDRLHLHRDDGPSVRWPDGRAVHHRHGTPVNG